jgi:t-SNARE complex subunit (syntaxin)
VIVANGEERLLVRAALDLREEIGQFVTSSQRLCLKLKSGARVLQLRGLALAGGAAGGTNLNKTAPSRKQRMVFAVRGYRAARRIYHTV